MIEEIRTLISEYNRWLNDKTSIRKIDGNWVEITTPHLDRHNDYLQLYLKLDSGGHILLSDDGYIINDLKLSGCEFTTKKRQDLLRVTLNGFGVKLEKEQLYIEATKENFALQKHNLIQAMLAINDMFYLSVSTVSSLFLEDVTEWLDQNSIRYIPRVKFTGKSGFDHLFDFAIPKSNTKPERILQTITSPTRSVQKHLFSLGKIQKESGKRILLHMQ